MNCLEVESLCFDILSYILLETRKRYKIFGEISNSLIVVPYIITVNFDYSFQIFYLLYGSVLSAFHSDNGHSFI